MERRRGSHIGGGRGRGRGQGRGMVRGRGVGSFRGPGAGIPSRRPLGVNSHTSSFKIAKSFSRAKDMVWRHDLFHESLVAAGISGVETGSKLYISNLDSRVSNNDMKELFSEIGELRRCGVHYNSHGRPTGSAEVVFVRRSDAIAAMKRYNNVQLDGKAMKIELIGTNLGLPVTPRVNVVAGANGRGKRTVVMMPEFRRHGAGSSNRGAGSRWNRGGAQPTRGRGRGRGRGGRGGGRGGRKKSAEELDQDLETYHAEAMNTS